MPNKIVVAIHQPNFLPWLGFFDKIARADKFVILDNIQFPKTGGTWMNRVKLPVNGQASWVTVPIVRAYHGVRSICEIEINSGTPWREKLKDTIRVNYSRAFFFQEVFSMLMGLIDQPATLLAKYNIHVIKVLADALRIDTGKFIFSSSLGVNNNATDLLIDIVKKVGGTSYLCGGGSAGYLEEDKFSHSDIELIYQNFRHPIYHQLNTSQFIPGLSIIDALMNCGLAGTKALVANE